MARHGEDWHTMPDDDTRKRSDDAEPGRVKRKLIKALDQRVKRTTLTPAGAALAEEARRDEENALADVPGQIPAGDRKSESS